MMAPEIMNPAKPWPFAVPSHLSISEKGFNVFILTNVGCVPKVKNMAREQSVFMENLTITQLWLLSESENFGQCLVCPKLKNVPKELSV